MRRNTKAHILLFLAAGLLFINPASAGNDATLKSKKTESGQKAETELRTRNFGRIVNISAPRAESADSLEIDKSEKKRRTAKKKVNPRKKSKTTGVARKGSNPKGKTRIQIQDPDDLPSRIGKEQNSIPVKVSPALPSHSRQRAVAGPTERDNVQTTTIPVLKKELVAPRLEKLAIEPSAGRQGLIPSPMEPRLPRMVSEIPTPGEAKAAVAMPAYQTYADRARMNCTGSPCGNEPLWATFLGEIDEIPGKSATPPLSGAIFTTTAEGGVVNDAEKLAPDNFFYSHPFTMESGIIHGSTKWTVSETRGDSSKDNVTPWRVRDTLGSDIASPSIGSEKETDYLVLDLTDILITSTSTGGSSSRRVTDDDVIDTLLSLILSNPVDDNSDAGIEIDGKPTTPAPAVMQFDPQGDL